MKGVVYLVNGLGAERGITWGSQMLGLIVWEHCIENWFFITFGSIKGGANLEGETELGHFRPYISRRLYPI